LVDMQKAADTEISGLCSFKNFGLDYFGILPWPGTAEILPFSGM
jgi:hypothetical protein